MDNIFKVSPEIPTHILAYWMGILVGYGVDYRINPDSPLHRSLRERKRERELDLNAGRGSLTVEKVRDDGVRVLTGRGNPDDVKLNIRVKYARFDITGSRSFDAQLPV